MEIYPGKLRRKTLKTFSILIYGEVTKCTIPLERNSGRKRGFGFVEMTSEGSEKTAIYYLQDVEWIGREIRVKKVEQKDRSRRHN